MRERKKQNVKPAMYVFKNGKWINVLQSGKPKLFINGKWQ